MRVVLPTLSILLSAVALFASEIREFNVKTLERLGNELTRISQTSDKGATTPERKRAKQTAIAALKGKLFDIHYDYVVLDDPAGHGFLVYALAVGKSDDFVLAGHFRVTISAEGTKAERIDALSRSLLIQQKGKGLPAGTHQVAMSMVQIVSSKPVETLIYTSNLAKEPIYVATLPRGEIWEVANGKLTNTGKTAGTK